jgi:hypothetical protein
MTKRALQVLSLVLAVLWMALPAMGATPNVTSSATAATGGGGFPPAAGVVFPAPPLDPTVAWKDAWICRAAGPAEVVGFRVQCAGATFLDFHIADCCIPGDHWQLKGKAWDNNPNTGVTTAPGPANLYSVAGRAYNYVAGGGTLDAYVECSYLHGVNVFLADSFVVFSSDGNCVVTPDPVVRRIDRTP